MARLKYRPEIDGLRAVAVIPVVLFHLDPGFVPGGFVGVDVFFVISGFLITSVILRETDEGSFTLRDFWMRRMRRLFPALAFLLLVVMGSGCFLLYEEEWRSLGQQVMAVLMLWANVFMRGELADYWGAGGEEVVLLHLWSLAVEEQFYLIFPLVLPGLLKAGRRWVLPIILAGALGSFCYGLWCLGTDPSAAFYLLPSRAWEMLAGAFLAAWIWRKGEINELPGLGVVGLSGIVVSYGFVRGGLGFPGWQALLPVLGTALVLVHGGGDRCLARRLLSAPPLVFVGKISYSLYLWHWPVIVFWRFQTQEDISEFPDALAIVLVSVLGATVSYYVVEQPFRRSVYPLMSGKGLVIGGGCAGLIVTAWLGALGMLRGPAEPAFERPLFTAQDYNAGKSEKWRVGGMVLGGDPPAVVVFGSSHALMYGSTVAEIAREQGLGVAFLSLGNVFGRFHSPGDEAIYRDAMADHRGEFDAVRMEFLQRWKPERVLWFGRWENQYEVLGAEEFERVIRSSLDRVLTHAGRVVLTTQIPFSMKRPGSVRRYATRRLEQGRPVVGEEAAERGELRRSANEVLRGLAAEDPRVLVVEAADLFEGGHGGGVRLRSQDGDLLYHDHHHLSDRGAALVRDRLVEALK